MNILGQPFSPWVTGQINARQKSLGDSTNLSNSNLLYQNVKTPWIRLYYLIPNLNLNIVQ